MTAKSKLQLWRVEWVHRNGYQAPYQVVEAKEYQEVHNQVLKNRTSRLLDFSDSWYFRIINLNKIQVNGKWY